MKRAHKTSAEIYDNRFRSMKEKELKKCTTWLFHLVRHGPLFAEDHRRCDGNREIVAAVAAAAAAASNVDADNDAPA